MKSHLIGLVILIISISFEVSGKKICKDCILFSLCPNAKFLVDTRRDNETINKFKEAFCGYETKAVMSYKICCSDFDDVANKNGQVSELDSIENHRNKLLLPRECGEIYERRILTAPNAALFEFNWMALIAYKTRMGYQFQCAGSIINSRYILTAAHCVVNQNIAGVRLGEYDIQNKGECREQVEHNVNEYDPQTSCELDLRVDSIISHEMYTPNPISNDIALIRLSKNIDFVKRNIKPICLPINIKLRNKTLADERGVVTGWGLEDSTRTSSIPHVQEVLIRDEAICEQYVNRNNQENNKTQTNFFCTGDFNKDFIGDSGGPLMIEETYDENSFKHRYIQYGIIYHGVRQGSSIYPSIYTNVAKYMDWILDHINE